jgi:hypothetical protein
MKLIKDSASAWDTYLVDGYPFGIEKIDRGAWFAFKMFGKNRIYLETNGMGRKRAEALLAVALEDYKSRIITAVEA